MCLMCKEYIQVRCVNEYTNIFKSDVRNEYIQVRCVRCATNIIKLDGKKSEENKERLQTLMMGPVTQSLGRVMGAGGGT